jgi:hypothetical protein
MKYITERETYKDKKKVVGARVPEMILKAINNAKGRSIDGPIDPDSISFSVSKIVEIALLDALKEIEVITGIDFYELEKFKYNIREWYDAITPEIDVDIESFIEKTVDDIEYEFYRSKEGGLITMSSLLNEKLKDIKTKWILESWESYDKNL